MFDVCPFSITDIHSIIFDKPLAHINLYFFPAYISYSICVSVKYYNGCVFFYIQLLMIMLDLWRLEIKGVPQALLFGIAGLVTMY